MSLFVHYCAFFSFFQLPWADFLLVRKKNVHDFFRNLTNILCLSLIDYKYEYKYEWYKVSLVTFGLFYIPEKVDRRTDRHRRLVSVLFLETPLM